MLLTLRLRIRFQSYAAAICYGLLLASVSTQAQVVHNLRKLVDSSDVVGVARIAAVRQTGSGTVKVPGGQSIPAHFRVATLTLEDVLKGKPASTDIDVRYTVLYSPAGWGGGVPQGYTIRDTLVPNSTRLVFLRSVGDHYEFANGSYLSIVCARTPGSGQSPDPFSRVLSCLSEVMFSASSSEQDKAEAIRQLGAVDSDSVVPALKAFLAGDVGRQNEFLRTQVLVALLGGHKDESVVGLAESELLSGSSAYWKSNLLFALTQAVPPSRSIPILSKALALPDAQTRTSAAVAIYQTNSPQGIRPLLRALDDPDPEVAFAVMQGLGNLTGNYEWRPKSTEADADWFRCLKHWLEFRERRDELR